MGLLADNIALLNLGANSGNYTRDSNNRFESTNITVDGDDSWDSGRGHRSHGKGGHKGGKGHGKGRCDD